VDREPGQTTKRRAPERTSSSTRSEAQRLLRFGRAANQASRAAGVSLPGSAGGMPSVNCRIFRLISANSSEGLEPGTMPAPAYTCSCWPSLNSAERSATMSSEPREFTMPQGAA